jgi:hypothetical protein
VREIDKIFSWKNLGTRRDIGYRVHLFGFVQGVRNLRAGPSQQNKTHAPYPALRGFNRSGYASGSKREILEPATYRSLSTAQQHASRQARQQQQAV